MIYWVKFMNGLDEIDVTDHKKWLLTPTGELYYFCEMTGELIKTDEFQVSRIY